MTREGAIGNLIHAIRWNDMPKKEALDMAIEALKQEPCNDMVSCGVFEQAICIYDNLKNWDFDIHSYPMPKAEADMVMELIQKSLEQKNTEDDLK